MVRGGVTGVGLVAFFLMNSSAAYAQFVCGGSANGADPNNGGGSTAVAGSVACGVNVTASGDSSFAAGVASGGFDKVSAEGKRSIAIGVGVFGATIAKGTEAIAIGNGAFAGGDSSIAIGGSFTSAGTGDQNIAIGGGINGSFKNTTVVGNTAIANGSNTVLIGQFAGGNDTANNAVAIGQNAQVKADNTTAVGQNTTAGFAGSAAFGQGASTTRADQQMFGTSTNTYTMAGLASAASRLAQGAPTSLVTSNAAGDLATYTPAQLGLSTTADVTALQSQINNLGQRDKQLAEGIATAAAMAQPILLSGQKFALRFGYGNFDGTSAAAVTAAGVLNRGYAGPTSSIVLDAGPGISTESSTATGRAGVTLGW